MKRLTPAFPTLSAIRHAGRDDFLRYRAAKAEIAAMRILGAREELVVRLMRDNNAAHRWYCVYLREQRRALLTFDDPPKRRKPRATTVPLAKRFPEAHNTRVKLLRKAKGRLVEGRMTLDQWREYESAVQTHYKLSCVNLAQELPLPPSPTLPRPTHTT